VHGPTEASEVLLGADWQSGRIGNTIDLHAFIQHGRGLESAETFDPDEVELIASWLSLTIGDGHQR
jgi:hypothetical protein